MSRRLILCIVLGLLAGDVCRQTAQAQMRPLSNLFGSKSKDYGERMQAVAQVPLERIQPADRPKIERVLQQPTLYTKGPAESFLCHPEMYYWLLDNPDRAMLAWRRLGAQCVEINNRGNGVFAWTDDQGSEVTWRVVYPGPNLRIWYAEGQVKPGPLLPMVPVQTVVVLQHGAIQKQENATLMHQQADIFVHTDSRAASLATRLMGPSLPRLANEAAGQMQLFFAGMAWFCHQNPDRARELFRPIAKDEPAAGRVMSPFEFKQ